MKKKLLLLSFLLSSVLYSREMGLEEILQELEQKNSEIKIQELEVESKGIRVTENIKNIAPGINLSAQANLVERFETDNNGLVGPDTISASIPLYTGGVLTANYKKSKYEHLEGIEQLKIVKSQVENSAIATYFDILKAEKQKEILQATLVVLERQKKRVDTLFGNEKMVSKNEVLEIEASILSLENEMLRAENSMENAKQKMYILLDLPFESEINFVERRIPEIEYAPELKKDIEYSETEGKYAKKSENILNRSKEDVKIARSGYLPKISMATGYKYANRDKDEKAWAVSVTASMNIFQWGATGDAVRRAEIDVEQTKMKNKKEFEDLRLSIVQKHKEIELLNNELKISDQRLEILRENSKIQNVRYTNGMISSLDYLESINLLTRAEENNYNVQKNIYLAKKQYNNFVN